MTTRSDRPLHPPRRLIGSIPLLFAFIVPAAHADWSIAIADAPATVIRGMDVYSAGVNQRLSADDMIESGANGMLLLQDDAGNVMALGPGTQILLESKAHVSLLKGWIKISHTCAASSCLLPAVETERGTLEVGDHAAAIVAAVSNPAPVSEVFSESGTQTLELPASSAPAPGSVALAEGHFASVTSGESADVRPRPSPAFLAGMPVAFQDALMRIPTTGKLRDDLPAPLRPVAFEDVAAWLTSALPARKQPETSFVERFSPRLADATFQQRVQQNLSALPEWRTVQPAPNPNPKADFKVAQKSTSVKFGSSGATARVPAAKGNSNNNASAANPADESKDTGSWFSRLFSGTHK
jgi:hypothetical protein